MLKRLLRLIVVALLVLAVGCAAPTPTVQRAALGTIATATSAPGVTGGMNASTTVTSSPSPTESSTDIASGPSINWDAPLGTGKLTSVNDAASDGQLTFTPREPRFPIEPTTVQVSDVLTTPAGDRAVAYIYKFPLGADFLTDGRIRVLEYATSSTEDDLEGVVGNPPGPAEDFAIVTVNDHSALLVRAKGVGRIQYIEKGIMYDITGPEAPVAVVEKLAAEM